MQAWWVTLAASLISGVVGAGLTRWWEQKREDTRWKRESTDRQVAREHDARMQWREHRVTIYVGLLTAIEAFGRAAGNRAGWLSNDTDESQLGDARPPSWPTQDHVEALANAVTAASEPVEIIATAAVQRAAEHAVVACWATMMKLQTYSDTVDLDPGANDVTQARIELVSRIREELHVDSADTPQEIVNPSRPSGPIS
ncbi:hypothetical protein [Actinokineospora terrae]|uniref:hypothetical protein n=1 Tax=Actinokineospora terrae TaxID=155974 RepID=UPI0011603496|nr:hypothetical protein [Actinokineospora terrae]